MLGGFGSLIRGAGDVGFVELLAQCAAVGELHHGQIHRHFERQAVAFLAFFLGGVAGGLHHVGGHALELLCAHVKRKFVGRVQRVFAELLRDLGQPFLDGGVAFFGSTLQFGTAQNKAAQGIFAGLRLLGIEAGGVNVFVFGVQALVAAQARPELGHAGQGGVVGGAQFGGVGHAVEVTDRTPGHAQPLGAHVQGLGNGFPVGRKVGGGDGVQGFFCGGQQFVQGRGHMLGGDAVKKGQAGGVEQGVGHGGS